MSGMQHGRECHTRTTAVEALSWMSARVAAIPRIPCAGAMVVVMVEGKGRTCHVMFNIG
jgi:hypothetical protein